MWLLKTEVAEAMQQAIKAGLTATAEQQAKFEGLQVAAAQDGVPRNYRVAGDVAEIRVDGILTERPSFLAWLFYGANTTYQSIRSGLALAEQDRSVKRAVVAVSSPGGNADGLFDTLASFESFSKPLVARASCACSAAYAIAAMADKIEASNGAAEFGSIGVAARIFHDDSIIEITSTEAPDKRPDPTTEEGRAVIRRYLDALHELFVDAIARGRETTASVVNKEFGRGATLLAAEAKRRGMVDKINGAQSSRRRARAMAENESIAGDTPSTVTGGPAGQTTGNTAQNHPAGAHGEPPAPDVPMAPATSGGPQKGNRTMNEEELKAQHPELHAKVLGKGKAEGHEAGKVEGLKEGREAGIKEERERCCAHLKMADSTGAVAYAHKCIESGAQLSEQLVQAEYMSAALKRDAVSARQGETDNARAIAGGAAGESGKSRAELVADAIERDMQGDVL